ncbi:lipase [Sorangium cellulosum]|uniref:Lipase n=1 Tax=Sorangium cellulosum TaxID=56 RepID=A0A4V0NCR8_SORCE|nr:alpha/beta fold hydrolase [Sorangium cellulosum]AUX20122.1 lipase [Sorangium cellulosum]
MVWTFGAYLLAALALAVLAAIALWAHLYYWVKRLTLPLEYCAEEVLETGDGARIELRRVPRPPTATEQPDLPPILLVHGLAANHRNQDIHPDYSLARHLAALGRDVWLLTLRSGRLLTRVERRSVRFSAMAQHDLPCAVDAVLKRTGARSLDYVGFSMGGMLLYAALGRSVASEQIRRVVIVGSPGRLVAPTRLLPYVPGRLLPGVPLRLIRHVPGRLLPGVPLRLMARSVAFASEWVPTPLHHAVANPRNVPPGVTRLALVNCIEDIPAALNADFATWLASDGEIRVNGERVLDGLASVAAPALFIAGSADRIAPVSSVRAAFDAWGRDHPESPKRFVVLGRDFGAREDYGHGDLAVGAYTGAELFEPIARFLGPDQQEQPADVAGPETGAPALEAIQARQPTSSEVDPLPDLPPA